MEEKTEEKVYCKKLVYGDKENPRVLYGLILSENETFLDFKTGKGKHTIRKDMILSISDTNHEFVEGGR